jgi:hypothetical protein
VDKSGPLAAAQSHRRCGTICTLAQTNATISASFCAVPPTKPFMQLCIRERTVLLYKLIIARGPKHEILRNIPFACLAVVPQWFCVDWITKCDGSSRQRHCKRSVLDARTTTFSRAYGYTNTEWGISWDPRRHSRLEDWCSRPTSEAIVLS